MGRSVENVNKTEKCGGIFRKRDRRTNMERKNKAPQKFRKIQ